MYPLEGWQSTTESTSWPGLLPVYALETLQIPLTTGTAARGQRDNTHHWHRKGQRLATLTPPNERCQALRQAGYILSPDALLL